MSTSATTAVRLDEVIYKKIDEVSPYLKYIGRADFGATAPLTSAAIWQILRVTTISGVETQQYAKVGGFNAIWDNRASYFGAFTAPVGVQGAVTVGTSAVAIRVGGSNLADRKTVTLYNNSSSKMYWGWDSSVTTSSGTPIAAGVLTEWVLDGEDITQSVQTVYVISDSGGNEARITESP